MDRIDPPVQQTQRSVAMFTVCVAVCIGAIFTAKYISMNKQTPFTLAPSTVLVLMVKNEEAIIERILDSAKGVLADYLVLCDTGSTDKTIAYAKDLYPSDRIHVEQFEFTNFEDARNECNAAVRNWLRQHQSIEWIALADADFTVSQRSTMAKPQHYVNTIQIHAGVAGHPHNSLNMLISRRAFRDCHYRLWTHEYLECEQPAGHYDGYYYVDNADGVSRPGKIERDIRLLKQWLTDKNETDLKPRALYYLSRAYEDSGQLSLAMETYEQHNKVQNFTNYLFYAKYRQALIQIKLDKSFEQIEKALLAAHSEYDGYFRREPLYYLARMARLKGLINRCILYGTAGMNAPPIDHARMPLFLENAVYEWSLEEELAFCFKSKGQTDRAKWHYKQILEAKPATLDKDSRERIQVALSLFYFSLLVLVALDHALEPHFKRPNAVHRLFQKGDAHNHVRIDSCFRVAVPAKFALLRIGIVDQMSPQLVWRYAKLSCCNVAACVPNAFPGAVVFPE